MTPGAKARILRVLDAAWKGVNELCEELDEAVIDCMVENPTHEQRVEARMITTLCVLMKDARAALERAKGAVP